MTETQDTQVGDPIGDLVWRALTASVAVGALLVALPLVVPTVAAAIAGETIATRTRFWVTYRWHWLINTIAITLVAALLVTEVLLLIQWGTPRIGDDRDLLVTLRELGGAAAPWLVGNVFAGILLLPVGWSVHRRRIARQCLRGADVLDTMPFPQPVGPAEGGEPALGGNARAGQHDDMPHRYSPIAWSRGSIQWSPSRNLKLLV